MNYKNQKVSQLDTINKHDDFIKVLEYYDIFQPISKYKIICPFHGDVNPSMIINLENDFFYCFGCQAHGSTHELLKYFNPDNTKFENLILLNKIRKGVKVERQINIVKNEKKKNINAARDYYFNLKKVNWRHAETQEIEKAKSYLRKRGFNSKVLSDFDCRLNENNNYSIIFPIKDNGVFRGYVCRTTVKEVEKKRKYLYNSGFRRAKTLAGRYDNDVVIVVEGFLDMVKACQMGLKFVVASLGWKMSEQQLIKLKRKGVKKIICALDNDECGRKGYYFLKSKKMFEVIRLHYPKGIKDFGDVNKKIYNKYLKKQIERNGGK